MGAGTGAAKKLPCSSALAFLYNLNIDSMHFKIYEKNLRSIRPPVPELGCHKVLRLGQGYIFVQQNSPLLLPI